MSSLHGGSIAGLLAYDGPAISASRPGNKALALDGDGDYVRTPLDDLAGSEITIAYWFKGSFHRSIVRQQSSGYIVAGYSSVHILSNDGLTSGLAADNSGGATVQDGEWHHVAMTWKQNSTDGFATYLDGELVASRNSSNLPIPDHSVDTFIGSDNGIGEFTNGVVDDVAIWDRALGLEEIRDAMNAPLSGSESGLVGYWNFDNGTANDLTVAANHGQLFGDAAIIEAEDLGLKRRIIIEATPDSPDNQVLCLDGNNDHIIVNSLTNLSGDELTISCWFKGSVHRSLVRQQTFGNNYISLGYGAVHILSNDGLTTGLEADSTNGATVVDGDWHHLVMSWKRNSTDGFTTYLDGMEVASRSSSNNPIPNHNVATYFGAANGTAEFTNGCLDEIAIWSRALSSAEVASTWNQRLMGDEEGLVGYWNFDDGTAGDATANNHDGVLMNGAAIMPETVPNLDGVPLDGAADAAGPYLLEGATEGVNYFIDAYLDANGNGMRDDDEWRASFPANPLTIAGDVTGIDLDLYDPASVWLQIVGVPGGGLEIQWPEFATGIMLTSASNLGAVVWDEFGGEISTVEGVRSASPDGGLPAEFFRLEDERR